MSAINSVPPNIFNAEFLNSPAATAAAWISIIGTFFLIIKLAGTLFKYRKHHNKILKKSGVPAFILNTFLISISLRKLPKIDLPDKIVAVVFSVIFLFASGNAANLLI
jgi:asparagine N-glycosylation enzyme membrane subunit Stt3